MINTPGTGTISTCSRIFLNDGPGSITTRGPVAGGEIACLKALEVLTYYQQEVKGEFQSGLAGKQQRKRDSMSRFCILCGGQLEGQLTGGAGHQLIHVVGSLNKCDTVVHRFQQSCQIGHPPTAGIDQRHLQPGGFTRIEYAVAIRISCHLNNRHLWGMQGQWNGLGPGTAVAPDSEHTLNLQQVWC